MKLKKIIKILQTSHSWYVDFDKSPKANAMVKKKIIKSLDNIYKDLLSDKWCGTCKYGRTGKNCPDTCIRNNKWQSRW
jgi:hypothetical protein